MNSDESGKVLDVNTALAHVDGDAQLLSELAEIFLQDYPGLMEDARRAIEQVDGTVLERTAHTLRGRLAFFGIRKLRDRLAALESNGREQNMAGASELLAEVETEMTPILSEFKELILENPL